MSLCCFTNFSRLPICVKFFGENREEHFLPYEIDILRNNYDPVYEILSVVIEEDFIQLTIYKPAEYLPQ